MAEVALLPQIPPLPPADGGSLPMPMPAAPPKVPLPAPRPQSLPPESLQPSPAPEAPAPRPTPRRTPRRCRNRVPPPTCRAPGAQQPAPAEAELVPAPMAVLQSPYPTVPYRKGTFGSEPIRLSRDYPPLTDFFRCELWDRLTAPDPGVGPATDRDYAQLEYLLWWTNRDRIPVLATTSTTGGNGFLGDPGTVAILGPGQYGSSARNGLAAAPAPGWTTAAPAASTAASSTWASGRTA